MNLPLSDLVRASLAAQLRSLRTQASLTRTEMRKRTGCDLATLAALETCGRGQVGTLVKVLDALGTRLVGQPLTMEIGTWLRDLRSKRSQAQHAAAQVAGLSKPTIIKLERGGGQVSSLCALLAVYGVPVRLSAIAGEVRAAPLGRTAEGPHFEIWDGDCRDVMRAMIAEGRLFSSVICDPPYFLEIAPWDGTTVAFDVVTWELALQLLQPGGFLFAFGAPRTVHRLTTAIESAGAIIRDKIVWLYGSGIPAGAKDVSKAIDRELGAVRRVTGTQPKAGLKTSGGSKRLGVEAGTGRAFTGERRDEPATETAAKWSGWRTGLKPACEHIVVAQKPLGERNVARNVMRHGTGGLNVDACRVMGATLPKPTRSSGVHALRARDFRQGRRNAMPADDDETPPYEWRPSQLGRYPANIIHDGLEEDWGRYFYCAKADEGDRDEGNDHVAVKPTKLARYLVRLATPPGGTVLDPFAGSGSIGKGAVLEGFNYVGIELDPGYAAKARERIGKALNSTGSLVDAKKPEQPATCLKRPMSEPRP